MPSNLAVEHREGMYTYSAARACLLELEGQMAGLWSLVMSSGRQWGSYLPVLKGLTMLLVRC